MFGLEGKDVALLPFPVNNQDETAAANLAKLGPALGLSGGYDLLKASDAKSNLVCAKFGAAGIGMISQTRQRTNRSSNQEQILTHAVGRGALYRGFRTFLLNKLGISDVGKPSPNTVTIAIGELAIKEQVVAALQSSFSGKLQFQSLDTNTLSIKERAQAASTSMIYIAHMANPSGVLIAATFLPQGSVFLVLEDDSKGGSSDKRQVRDLLDVMGHFHLHWLQNLDGIANIIQKESEHMF